jgi:hypothetical protein
MPYTIVKKRNKFFVENKSSGRKFSKRPLPLSHAKAQLAALEIHAHDYKGKGRFHLGKALKKRTKRRALAAKAYKIAARQ